MDKFRSISLTRELVDKIEEYIKNHPERGYKSLADFVTEAVRKRCEELKILVSTPPEQPVLEHFNLNEDGVRILDRSLANHVCEGRIIDVYFKPDGVWCDYCHSRKCRHIQFALTVPAIQKVILKKEKEGWNLPPIIEDPEE
jgi:Arc/MetJ-type ribon-helix-helix transcriptional regulator